MSARPATVGAVLPRYAGEKDQPAPERGSRSVLRALELLELLAAAQRPLSLAQIAAALHIPKTSCLALVRALTAREFARQRETGGYVLGLRSFEVGAAYLRAMTPVGTVAGHLRVLTERLGMTSHFAVLDGDEVVYLAKHDPPGTGLRLASSLGARLPSATTAVGKAQLAFSDRADAAQPGHLGSERDQIRRRGHAVDDARTIAGIRCVAAPVFGPAGCCGAIGVSYLLDGGPAAAEAAELVMAAARAASAELGGGRTSQEKR